MRVISIAADSNCLGEGSSSLHRRRRRDVDLPFLWRLTNQITTEFIDGMPVAISYCDQQNGAHEK